jgi:multimeric flavodoxin WrbA
MKIVVLMGSQNKNGSTRLLVDSFVRGAESAGHTCEVIDVCRANVHTRKVKRIYEKN